MRKQLVAAGAAILTGVAATALGAAPAHAAGPLQGKALRIMPLGDSITFGVGSTTGNGYRQNLLDELSADGARVDYVGSLRSGTMADPDNEGHSGALISEIDAAEDTATSAYRPNVVLLHAGTNDTNRDTEMSTAPQRLAHLIDDIVAHDPGVVVVVAQIVPNANADAQRRVDAFNAAIPDLVNARSAQKVVLASMSRVTTAQLADGLHPNDSGFQTMADAWHSALDAAANLITPPVGTTPSCVDSTNGWYDRGQVAAGTGAPAAQVRLADIDGDGRDDYLVIHDNGALDEWMNAGGDSPGHAGWLARGQIAAGTGAPPAQVQLADIDGDRDADYLVIGANGSVTAWTNNGGDGSGGWAARGQIAAGVAGANPGNVRFADINGDGRADYLVVQPNGGPVTAWINNGGDGSGGWTGRGQIATGTGNALIAFADFNCDPKDDYLAFTSNTGALNAWINDGGDSPGHAGWIARGQVAAGTGAPGSQVVFADLDGDGRDDYLVLNPSNGAVHAWLNNGGDAS
jgi:lysophospholipase L1-like esterase